MKKIIFSIIAASTLLISGCGTSSFYAHSDFQDGIYYRASKEEQAQKELDNIEVLNLIAKTIQQATAFADTANGINADITSLLLSDLNSGRPWETNTSYWDYYPWSSYGYLSYCGPGYYGWGYTWDPWYYGPNSPWGPSYYYGWGWNPWYYGPSWSFYYGGYWGSPWDPYWGWGLYPPYYPPLYAHGGNPTGYYYGRRDEATGGSLSNSSRVAAGVRGNDNNQPFRGQSVRATAAVAATNTVRGRTNPANGNNFRRSSDTGNRFESDFNKTANTYRRDNGNYSWGNTIGTSRNDDRNSSYRNSSGTSFRSSGTSSSGSVRSSGGNGGGGGRVGPRR